MNRRTVASALFLALLAVSAVLAGTGSGQQAPSTGAQSGVNPDNVVLHLRLQPDGTAMWRTEYRIRLDDQNTTDAFEAVRRDIETNTSDYRERFANRMQRTVADAETTTGREMHLKNVTVEATRKQLPQDYGVITYRFTWTGFAESDGQTLTAGDALAGLFLDSETTLAMTGPTEYRVTKVSPPPDEQDSQTVLWRGPTDFGSGEPSVILTATAPSAEGGGEGGASGPNGVFNGSLLIVGLTAATALLLVGGCATVIFRRAQVGAFGEADEALADEGHESPAGETPPQELLSNEEQVLAVLDEHGGRVKQQEVAEELGWTDAKTSQVVRRLREEGKLTGFRLGRENVLSLPENDT